MLRQLQAGAPSGWTVAPHGRPDGGLRSVVVHPPADSVDATGYLIPPYDTDPGWTVRIWDRGARIDYPLYIPGGAHAAYYATAADAMDAAVNALRIVLS